MKGRPPHRGSGGKRPPGKPAFASRPGTGPRTSALEAAKRAARNRGEDAGERAPWGDAEVTAPPRPPRARKPAPDQAEAPPPRRPAPKATPPKAAASKPSAHKAPSPDRSGAPQAGPTRREQRAAASATLASGVQTLTVAPDEAGMRIDRFLSVRFPQLPFTRVQSLVRKGELRVDGKRAKAADRLEPGSSVRVPPLKLDAQPERPRSPAKAANDAEFLRSLILYEDAEMMILNKPFGLAVQGGSPCATSMACSKR
jgi:23S rRNA pseudouridine955/2504/2580 synthase